MKKLLLITFLVPVVLGSTVPNEEKRHSHKLNPNLRNSGLCQHPRL